MDNDIYFFIANQEFISDENKISGGYGKIMMSAIIDRGNKITDFYISSYHENYTIVIIDNNNEKHNNSICLNETQCLYQWIMYIYPEYGICTLKDDYHFAFEIDNNRTGNIMCSIESEYFCSQVIDNIDVSGYIYVIDHDDTPYFIGDKIKMNLVVRSFKATIISAIVKNIILTNNNSHTMIYEDGKSPDAINFELIHSGNNNIVSFILDPSIINIEYNYSTEYNILVTIVIEYDNTNTRKRENKNINSKISTSIMINGKGHEDEMIGLSDIATFQTIYNDKNVNISPIIIIIFVLCTVVSFFLIYLFKIRKGTF